MRRADEPGLVRMVADRHERDVDARRFQQHRGAADRELADAALAQAATDRDALGVAPAFEAQKRRMTVASSCANSSIAPWMMPASGSPSTKSLSSFFFEMSRLGVSPSGSSPTCSSRAPTLEDRPEGAVARAVADEALLVAQLDIVAVDDNRRQVIGPVGDSGGDGG